MNNDNRLREAYKILVGKEPSADLAPWQIAEVVMAQFDARKFSERNALLILNEVVNGVEYPTAEKTREVVLRAEAIFAEIIPEELRRKYGIGDEPHMNEMEALVLGEYGKEKEYPTEIKVH